MHVYACTCEWQPRSSQRSAKFSVPSVPPVMYTVWNMLTSVIWWRSGGEREKKGRAKVVDEWRRGVGRGKD